MLLEKIKQYNIDPFIEIVDDYEHNMYRPNEYQAHANYNSFKLAFSFENWTHFYSDKKPHIEIIAKYVNANGKVLVKYQSENFDYLCAALQIWCNQHRAK